MESSTDTSSIVTGVEAESLAKQSIVRNTVSDDFMGSVIGGVFISETNILRTKWVLKRLFAGELEPERIYT